MEVVIFTKVPPVPMIGAELFDASRATVKVPEIDTPVALNTTTLPCAPVGGSTFELICV